MKIGLIGSTGFVGGNLAAQYSPTKSYNSKNIEEIRGEEFDLVLCAAAPAAMWVANQKPEEDLENLERLMSCLSLVKASQFILISTIAVYPDPIIEVDEDSVIDTGKLLPYGKHRLLLEDFIRDRFNSVILRLPGLFGEGIKKNAIFDFLNDNRIQFIDSRGIYQYYGLMNLRRDIERATENGISLLNLSAEPISISELARECFGREFENHLDGIPVHLDFRSKHFAHWGGSRGYLFDKSTVIKDVKAFIHSYKAP